ncbi:SGNH/GDSL hydrolase family protein [Ornithinibacillus sp. L9]|uniref:SGNH/GDSL hydrolase family protein n=1 Tax=Ornithinibacillus caprae TaxID=2678566 RepID=A0A6N8FQ64_9BACI|nr:SGNH/GDSL hydrolase family protein [Ornithinibacillus caprae]MUK90089.1 SGNH/GDSL hydrolase family protein [Ornithinibacillus caprae]
MRLLLYIVSSIVLVFFIFVKVTGSEETANEDLETNGNWVGAWSTSMQAPFNEGVSDEGFENQTVRQIMYPHADGQKIRIRLSNVFGSESLTINEVYVAVAEKGAENVPGTEQQITFSRNKSVTIPPGEIIYSDPIDFEVKRRKNIAISFFVQNASGPATWHPRSLQTTYIATGNHASDSSASDFQTKEEAWFWVDGLDVIPNPSYKGAIAVVGSSITNGNYSKLNANNRWTDYLAKRLQEDLGVKMSVLNAGISANQLIKSDPEKGENALDRLERDVYSRSGVKGVILHQGLNDIRHHPEYGADKIIERIRDIIKETHNQGLKIYVGTLTPFKGSGMYTEEKEEIRQEVNKWIRTSDEFDGVIDFDEAVRNPDSPKRFLPRYDSGDHLHPNDAGYKKMTEAVDLRLFE